MGRHCLFSSQPSGFARSLGISLALAVVASTASVVAEPKATIAAPTPTRQAPLERGDEAAAVVTARMTRKPVKITGLTSETSEFVAQPNGTVVATIHAAPVRINVGGRWIPVDLNLRRTPDGTVTAFAHPGSLTLAGRRDKTTGALATVGSGGDKISLGWTGKLPDPVIDGTKAILYVNGVKDGEQPRAGAASVVSSPVGMGWACEHGTYRGVLDDVRIYKRALSADEIRSLVEESR